jgi:hypothetical protein
MKSWRPEGASAVDDYQHTTRSRWDSASSIGRGWYPGSEIALSFRRCAHSE